MDVNEKITAYEIINKLIEDADNNYGNCDSIDFWGMIKAEADNQIKIWDDFIEKKLSERR